MLQQQIRLKAVYWKQRSKEKVIKESDSNTKFHHAQATQRMRKIFIREIQVDGQRLVNHDGKVAALTDYFTSIIGVQGSSQPLELSDLYAGSYCPSQDITAPFTLEEAKKALLSMNMSSAPGPDGFVPVFFRAAWDSVKPDLLNLLCAFHHGEIDLQRLNRSHMVLIPKKPGAVEVSAFRPIALQNCCLKIISKVLTSRLQEEIPKLIDLNQTGFIRGRSITDTFVYAMELVQVCHKRKMPAIVLKLDFAKAFDTVNWEGLFQILQARNFPDIWIRWIKCLLSSALSAVLVNGSPGPWIICGRGLRQGDPISPYLFLLVAETLQCMIKKSQLIRHPTEHDLPPAVLQYADDTLLVLRGDLAGAVAIKDILDSFAAFTGLHINYGKSTLVPINMPEHIVHSCVQAIGCKREGFPQPYLGLPLSIHKLPISAFTPYIHKADRRLSSWQAFLLNKMGLINSVLDSQLVYVMSSLQLPPGVISSMDKTRRAFLWSGDKSGKSSAASCLVAWTNVCNPKEQGGLGIRDTGIQNACLLLKLLHRLHCAESSAWSSWVQNKISLASLQGDIHGEHWNNLKQLLPLYQAITSVELGNGQSTSFWNDVWLADDALADVYPALFSHCNLKSASVKDIMSAGLSNCLVPRLSAAAQFELQEAQHSLIGLQLSDSSDRRISAFARHDSNLDSGAIYKMIKAKTTASSPKANFIWKSYAPPRVQLFMWLLCRNRIQCRSVLFQKKVVDDPACEICHSS